jgi:ribosomal protein S18 acetylase RimI-like enzyme
MPKLSQTRDVANPANAGAGPELFEASFARRAPGFQLRRVQADDAGFLWTLFNAVQGEMLDLPPALVRLQFESQTFTYASAWPGAIDWIVQRSGRPIGRMMLDFTAADRVHGVDLAVLPGERGGAAGLHLLRAWMAACDRLGREATLHVRPGNPAAGIYRRLGFVETDLYAVPVPMRRSPRSRG